MLRQWAGGMVALAGLAGASGVLLAATAAHGVPTGCKRRPIFCCSTRLQRSHFRGFLSGRGDAADGFSGCGFLFGGDLSARALAGTRLFPMAAPLGGTLLILGWVFVVPAAFVALRRGKPDQNLD